MPQVFRRIVTGHDEQGHAVCRSDELLDTRMIPSGEAAFRVAWTTATAPADNADETDGASRATGLALKGGSVLRVVDLAPLGRSPMHRTHSLDYGIILRGRVDLELDGGEVLHLHSGDIVVQRGTSHLWFNPSHSEWSRVAFVLLDALPVSANGAVLEETHL
jgi:quercetin dioxygenase-like cupin family protein